MKRRILALVLLLILGAGLFLRIYDLGRESFWLDEGSSVNLSIVNISRMVDYMTNDVHPPLYFILLRCWVKLFGTSEVAVRSLSMIFGFFSIFVMYKIGRLLFDEASGLFGALILAVSVFHIQYSQEARMYSLLVLMTLCSFYYFIRILKERELRAAIGYTVSSLLLIYTHLYGYFVIIAQNIFVFILFALRERHELTIKKWLFLQGTLFILLLPWIGILINQIARVNQIARSQIEYWWIKRPSALTLLNTLISYAGSKRLLIVLAILLLSSFVMYEKINGKISSREFLSSFHSYRWSVYLSDMRSVCLLGVWFLTPILLPFFISLFMTPMYHTRYTIISSPALYLLAAKGIRNINARYIRMAIAGIVVVFSLSNITRYYIRIDKEQWRQAASYIDATAKRGDLVLFDADFSQIDGFDLYSHRKDIVKRPLYKKTVVEGKDNAEFRSIVDTYDRVWIVLSHSRIGASLVEKRFSQFYALAGHNRLVKIEVYLFKKRGRLNKG